MSSALLASPAMISGPTCTRRRSPPHETRAHRHSDHIATPYGWRRHASPAWRCLPQGTRLRASAQEILAQQSSAQSADHAADLAVQGVSYDHAPYHLARNSTPARNVGWQVSQEGIRMNATELVVFLIFAIIALGALLRIVTIRGRV